MKLNWQKILLYFYLSLIFLLQLIPLGYSNSTLPLDKIYHCASIFILAFIFYLNKKNIKKVFWLTIVIALFLEFIQIPIAYRSASIYDLLADFSGLLLFLLAYYFRFIVLK